MAKTVTVELTAEDAGCVLAALVSLTRSVAEHALEQAAKSGDPGRVVSHLAAVATLAERIRQVIETGADTPAAAPRPRTRRRKPGMPAVAPGAGDDAVN